MEEAPAFFCFFNVPAAMLKEFHTRSSYTNFEEAILCTSKVISNVKVVRTDKQTDRAKTICPRSARDGGIIKKISKFLELYHIIFHLIT